MAETTVSATIVRRLAIAAQGYAARSRRATTTEVEETIRRLSCVQLDSISAVERSHRIALGRADRRYPRETVSRLLGAGPDLRVLGARGLPAPGRGLAALPRPRWRTAAAAGTATSSETHPQLAEEFSPRSASAARSPSRDFDGAGGGGMWNWKPAKAMLEGSGTTASSSIAGRQGFQRLYDLAERVIPREVLEAPEPDEASGCARSRSAAVRARGALTAGGDRRALAASRRRRARSGRIVDALVAEGALERVQVDDGGADVFVPAGADLDPPRADGRGACSRRSTTCSGIDRSLGGSSASTT